MSQDSAKRAKGKNFSSDEDFEICKSWKSMTMDSITGTDQSSNYFWQKVRDDAAKSISCLKERTFESIRQRFGLISRSISKFSGCYGSVVRLNQSGKSAEDKFHDALTMYKKENESDFKYRSCWELLKDLPKFTHEPQKKRQLEEPGEVYEDVQYLEGETPSTSSNSSPRPIGQKQAKKLKMSDDMEQRRVKSLEEIADAATERNQLLKEHSKALQMSNDVQLMGLLTMDTSQLDPVAKEIIEIKKQQYLRDLQQQED